MTNSNDSKKKDPTKDETAESELTEEDLEKVAGGRSPAEDFVKGQGNPFGTVGAGGGGAGAGGNLAQHEIAHVNQQSGGRGRGKP